jgi:hypothetical protein
VPNPYTWVHEERLCRVPDEYRLLMRHKAGRLSIEDFFSDDDFHVGTYRAPFLSHPRRHELAQEVARFVARFSLDPDGRCRGADDVSAYLYPAAPLPRLVTIGQLIAVDSALDAAVKRDLCSHLAGDVHRAYAAITARMTTGAPSADAGASRFELAQETPLAALRRRAPIGWFLRFLDCRRWHLELTHQDRGCRALGVVPTVTEYLYEREMTGGMNYRTELIEFANDDFLDWDALRAAGLDGPLTRMRRLSGVIAGAGRDVLSFERECIDNTIDNNLLLLHLLNDPSLTLREAIDAAAATTRGLLAEFFALDREIGAALERPDLAGSVVARTVSRVVAGLRDHLRSNWVWQGHRVGRYQRSRSLFRELGPVHARASS